VDPCTNPRADWLAWLPPLLLAPFIGSFLGVLVLRLPKGLPVVLARSVCDHCGHRLGVGDLVPLLSHLRSRGRCRYCDEPTGAFYPAIELAALVVAAWAAMSIATDELWWTCLLGWTLLTLTWIDVRDLLLPDVLTVLLLAAGLIVIAFEDPASLTDHVIAAVLGYLGLVAIAWSYRRIRGRDGLGMGDAKLLAAIGAWLGLGLLPFTLLLAACLGPLAAGGATLAGKRITATTPIPFGACLALAAWLVWLYANSLEAWFLR
jgi:leader peptidase (prepilin peptidase)/N-methyltransferase